MSNKLKINYRIIEIDENNHSFVVRYWTDKLSEDSLATALDNEGNIIRGNDGKPVRCSTDVNITLYDNFNPSDSDITKLIMENANVLWFYIKEELLVGNNVFSMKNVESVFQKPGFIEKDIPSQDQDVTAYFTGIGEALKRDFPGKDVFLSIKSSNTNNNVVKVEYV